MKTIRALLAALVMMVVSQGAVASACLGPSPFDDIPQNDPICSNADWLKNRGVTLGCTAELYCPLDPVSRAQMALFMNRLAIALVPSVNMTEDSDSTIIDLDTESFHCVTPTYLVTDFTRTIILHASFSGLTTGAAAYFSSIHYNTTGSSTVFPSATNTFFDRVGATGATWTNVGSHATLNLDLGTSYRFAIRVARASGLGNLTDMRCNLMQILQPRERNSILP
jgi:hypothetical protein